MKSVKIIPLEERGKTELDKLQLDIEDLIFRWTQAGTPIILSMKDSLNRVITDSELIEYFYKKLRLKFYP